VNVTFADSMYRSMNWCQAYSQHGSDQEKWHGNAAVKSAIPNPVGKASDCLGEENRGGRNHGEGLAYLGRSGAASLRTQAPECGAESDVVQFGLGLLRREGAPLVRKAIAVPSSGQTQTLLK